ncbi:MAG: ATP-binding protein [Pseudomonadota bacterium]
MSTRLQQEQAKLLFRFAPSVSISMMLLQLASVYFFWGLLPASLLLPWFAINFLLSLLLLFVSQLFKRRALPQSSGRWILAYSYLALLQDGCWGAIGPMSFLLDDPLYHLLTLFMLAGISAGALTSRAVVFKTYAVSILALLTPTIIALALQGTPLHEGMLLLTVVYLLFMLSAARSYTRNIARSILLWMDNEKLVEELRQSRDQLERSNRELTAEIEQRELVEQDLKQSRARAERASAAKNHFLANVSHELRTPLNGIIGFTSILEKEALAATPRGYVGQIGKSAGTLLRLVNDILDITAIEAGQLKLHPAPFSLHTEVGEVVAILRPVAERKGLTLQWEHAEPVADTLIGDANRLRQVLSNLLSNAIKYTDEGEVVLRVSEAAVEGEAARIRFAVSDTGVGIPKGARATLFDNFTRVEGFETRQSEGVGLGLSIVKNLLQQMGGTVRVQSEPGRGSCFTVELPFDQDLTAPVVPSKPAVRPDPRPLQRLRVLVVDDNDINRLVLTSFLKHSGIEYSEAASGAGALAQINANDFDLVLLDIQMPEVSGIEVAQTVMAMDGEIPALIAVTAHAFPEQRQEIIHAGFSDLLIKPIAEDDLLAALERLVAARG